MDFYSEDLAMAADGIRNHSFTEGKKKLLLDYILGLYRYGIDSEKKPHRFDVVKPQRKRNYTVYAGYSLRRKGCH